MRSFLERTWNVAKDDSFTVSPRTIASQISSRTASTKFGRFRSRQADLAVNGFGKVGARNVFPPCDRPISSKTLNFDTSNGRA